MIEVNHCISTIVAAHSGSDENANSNDMAIPVGECWQLLPVSTYYFVTYLPAEINYRGLVRSRQALSPVPYDSKNSDLRRDRGVTSLSRKSLENIPMGC